MGTNPAGSIFRLRSASPHASPARMASGLLLLLDDVAAIAKVAASSIDDIAAAGARAGAKAAGVVIDDAAVTPSYVVGFAAEREVPIVLRIARGSLFNKLVILLPALLALSAFAPWAVTPLLMLGGLYLCFEGAEKLWEKISPHAAHDADEPRDEETLVKGAIRTDLILSAEIMAITLATVTDSPLWQQGLVLAVVGIAITVIVYGAVAMIVKADDLGVFLAQRPSSFERAVGRGLVAGMPGFLVFLGMVGTVAMLWVGGGIILHGAAEYGVSGPEHVVHAAAVATGNFIPGIRASLEWVVTALGGALVGVVLGGLVVLALHALPRKAHA
jgi:predicted DNA repair protein MutK